MSSLGGLVSRLHRIWPGVCPIVVSGVVGQVDPNTGVRSNEWLFVPIEKIGETSGPRASAVLPTLCGLGRALVYSVPVGSTTMVDLHRGLGPLTNLRQMHCTLRLQDPLDPRCSTVAIGDARGKQIGLH